MRRLYTLLRASHWMLLSDLIGCSASYGRKKLRAQRTNVQPQHTTHSSRPRSASSTVYRDCLAQLSSTLTVRLKAAVRAMTSRAELPTIADLQHKQTSRATSTSLPLSSSLPNKKRSLSLRWSHHRHWSRAGVERSQNQAGGAWDNVDLRNQRQHISLSAKPSTVNLARVVQ